MKVLKTTLAVALALSANATLANDNADQQADSIKDAVANGEVHLNFRYRLEDVDQNNPLNSALASTLRSRLTFKTKEINNFSAIFEADDVTNLFKDGEHNSLRNGITNYSVVADPESTEINQFAISYSGFDKTKITFGRQRVNLDNQRFIGGVGWRQNEQTYDALTIVNNSLKDSQIVYGYVSNVNNILGDNIDTDAHLLNYNWSGSELFKLSAYGYFLDLKNLPAASTRTLGVRFTNTKKSDFLWAFEYAKQVDYADNLKDLSANYYLAEAGYKFDGITAKLGREVMTGDANNSGHAFQTALGTKHKFQGWADLFLNTPDAGIEDTYLSFNTAWSGFKFAAIYHDFQAEDSNLDYGSEIDFVVSKKLSDEYSVALKFADYSADMHAVDTRKIWLTFSASY